MWLEVPFVEPCYVLDTQEASPLVAGPSAETVSRLCEAIRFGGLDLEDLWGLGFASPGFFWEIREVADIQPHPVVPDAWWIMGAVALEVGNNMDCYILWAPERSGESFLALVTDLIQIR